MDESCLATDEEHDKNGSKLPTQDEEHEKNGSNTAWQWTKAGKRRAICYRGVLRYGRG